MTSLLRLTAAAAFTALALAAFGCGSGDKGGGGGAGGDPAATNDDHCGKTPDGAPTPPKHRCSSDEDPRDACPLPKSVSVGDVDGTTVYYFSDPTCDDSVCHYCVTSTYTEDPNATAGP